MTHGAPTEWEKEKSEGFKRKLGLAMFAAYSIFYLIFVFLCVINPKLVATEVGGLNIAVVYGFALIVIAVIQALVYNFICARKEKADTHNK
jgi:uncharacterized membrane protein (DUF485 family)